MSDMRHRFHSICPYFAMFPETFAERWIGELTKPGEVVLDPFSGRGTTALTAVLMKRRAVACDVNDVAYCLTGAKTHAPSLPVLRRRLTRLENGFNSRAWRTRGAACSEFLRLAYHSRTLEQLLYLRAALAWKENDTDRMVAALVLGSLHGEADKSQSYFSNQMPRTISTKPRYSVRFWKKRGLVAPHRDVFDILRKRADFRYASEPPRGECVVLHRDMRDLPWLYANWPSPIRCVVTSPPYFDVTNFEEDQWLRLWFLGGPPRPTTGRLSTDDRHGYLAKYCSFLTDMWRTLGRVVARKGHVVIRIGSTRLRPDKLVKILVGTSRVMERRVRLESKEESALKNRQTERFRPGSRGCLVEVDCHLRFRN